MRTDFIRERLNYEKHINYKREILNELYDEYPFSKDGDLPSDFQIRSNLFKLN